MINLKYAVLQLIVFCIINFATGQVTNDTTFNRQQLREIADSVRVTVESFISADSIQIPFQLGDSPVLEGLDSVFLTSQDSLLLSDSLQVADSSIVILPNSDINTTILYKARDSIYFDVVNQQVYMYGESDIDYGDIKLAADRIDIDWKTDLLTANYTVDTSGAKVGVPVFTQGSESYEAQDMTYNFVTRKAVINGIVTQQGEAFMHGEKVKKNEANEMFIRRAKYTTCNLADPHFHISSSKLKVIPGNKVVTGPFNLYFRDIPTPLGFFFGMFPEPKKKTSGVIFPSYGEERRRGFFLRNGGYYFALSDFIDLEATADIYSKGGYGLQLNSQYKKRYEYNGTLNLTYNEFSGGNEEDSLKTKDFWVRWSHSPESKGRSSRISASVNAGSSTFNSNRTNTDIRVNQTAQFSSSVSYSKTVPGSPFNLTASMRHNQNVQSKEVRLTLPELAFSINRLYPFVKKGRSSKGVIQKINLSHNFNFRNELSNSPTQKASFPVSNRSEQDDSLISFSPKNFSALLDRAKIGGRHTVPISTSLTLFKYFTVSPSANYTELWYPRELRYEWEEEKQAVRVDTLRKFSRTGSYNFNAGTSTRLYGMYYINGKKIEAIRHVMTPTVSFGYTPDFTEGNYQEVQINEKGDKRLLSKYEGFAFGSPSRNAAASMSFSLQNNIEMKVKTPKDSVNASKKVKLMDNISMSSGYNFLADSFKLSDIRISTRTSLFNGILGLSASGALDPYVYILDSVQETKTGRRVFQRQIDEFSWNRGKGVGQLTRGTISADVRLSPKSFQSGNSKDRKENDEPQNGFSAPDELGTSEEREFIESHPDLYVDWNLPWSLTVGYNMNYSRRGFEDSRITQTLRFSGDLSITEKTKISFSSGYDFERQDFTSTRLSASRDLHCWVMNFNWVPFGRYQSFLVEIRVRSSLLQDLKLDKKSQFF